MNTVQQDQWLRRLPSPLGRGVGGEGMMVRTARTGHGVSALPPALSHREGAWDLHSSGAGSEGTSMLRVASRPGFTLMETLIAIAIFMISLVAIAALFPVGFTLQRYALGDAATHAVAGTAPALIRKEGLTASDLMAMTQATAAVQDSQDFATRWSRNDRTYPGTTPQSRRTVYWYPLLQLKGDNPERGPNWVAYVLIFQREHNDPENWMYSGTGPEPAQQVNVTAQYEGNNQIRIQLQEAGQVRTGEVLLDGGGSIRRARADPDDASAIFVSGTADDADEISEIWIGRRSATGQPTLRRIVPVADFAR